ncbi:hypothetical protein FUAX_02050 [Fulvitalea axinellae]|uniref:Uncharacterized protein n=1 Tax=Fulvitalea axinellae TaxID=1182444 RepID=A0AAU9CIF4_9BACT|nr:hypothetical protein FUAX_02050 [Fulvitalea axinellae]
MCYMFVFLPAQISKNYRLASFVASDGSFLF